MKMSYNVGRNRTTLKENLCVYKHTYLLTYLLTSSTPTIDATADEHTKLLTNLLLNQWLNTSQYPYREQKQFRHE